VMSFGGDCTSSVAAATGVVTVTCVSISGQKFTLAAGAPTSTNGSVGDYYTDSTNKCLYMATTAGTPATWSQIYCYAADGARYIGAYNTSSNPTCNATTNGMMATVGTAPNILLQVCQNGTGWVTAGGGTLTASGTPTNHQWAGWTSATAIKGFTVTSSKPVCTDSSGDPAVCAGTEGVWQTALTADTDYVAAHITPNALTTCTTARTITFDYRVQTLLLTAGDTCALTFTAPASSKTGETELRITQASTPTGAISGCKWPSAVTPTITATASAVDWIRVIHDGTNAYCFVIGQDMRWDTCEEKAMIHIQSDPYTADQMQPVAFIYQMDSEKEIKVAPVSIKTGPVFDLVIGLTKGNHAIKAKACTKSGCSDWSKTFTFSTGATKWNQ
jgi:hypothetical protein